MPILLEIFIVAVLAILAARLIPQPLRAKIMNVFKLYLTVRMVWLLLAWPMKMEDGTLAPAWSLVLDAIANIDAFTFFSFLLIGAAIRFVGISASMLRWQLVLLGQGIEMPFRHIFGAFLIGRAIGFFLPSTAGLDAYKLYDAARFSGKTVEVTAGTVLEKVLGVTGIFLTFLIALPFGVSIFGENATAVATITVPLAAGIISTLLVVLWFPNLVQWVIENIPLPGKARLQGVILRISSASAAYRDKKTLVVSMLGLSFAVHFTTASMYYFMALAVGVGAAAAFWPIVFGSSIQIFATVIGPTVGGLGIREAAQALTIGSLIGVGPAILSATIGFWVGEFPTIFGFIFWFLRGTDYRPAYCRVNGDQVDYEEAAKAATTLETDEERNERATREEHDAALPPMGDRILTSAGYGLGAGVLTGVIIGVVETIVIAGGGFGAESQVLWYGPLAYAVVLGGLCTVGGVVLGVLPMDRDEIRGWTPSLAMLATLVPMGLFITVFRLRRDVYAEQMPPVPVLLGVLAAGAVVALILFFGGRRIFQSPFGVLTKPGVAVGLLVASVVGGAVLSSSVFGAASTECASAPIAEHLADRPNLILVMVDTLRADHLSCYGSDAVRTPNLCSLAADGGSRFEAYSHASWTKPATASLLTSLLPSSHNAMSKPSSLSPEVDLVSEVLKDHGYTTGGIVSNINLAESFGFDQGYDEYHYMAPAYIAGAEESSSKLILYQLARQIVFRLKSGITFDGFYQDSERVNEVAMDWIDRHQEERFFLFLHYMDPHDPYFVHPYNGEGIARVSNQNPDPALAEEMHRLYVGEIEYLDGNFGKLLAKLRQTGVYDDTVIMLVADHGEEFQEHGGWWHGLTLYDEQIAVPLLVKWAEGDRAAPPVSGRVGRLIDVVPTLLARAGASATKAMQGVDLSVDESLLPPKDLQVFSEEDHEGNALWSLRTREWKLIQANPDNPRGLPEQELFRVATDPQETRNLAGADHLAVELELAEHADLQRAFAEGEAVAGGGDAEMTLEECRQLMNLGYVEDCSHLN
jgi:arylsulfatase A-like enzyme